MTNYGRILLALLASTALAGCGTIRGAADALKEEPRSALNSPNIVAAEAMLPTVRNLGYALALQNLPNCAGLVAADGSLLTPATANATCTPRTTPSLSSENLNAYIDRSIFVVDAYCGAYLDSLSGLGESSRWTRSQFNTIANYIGVLLAIAGEPAETLGYLNAGTGFFNSSAENLESFVLISPSPGKLTPLVQSAQQAKRNELGLIRGEDERLRWSTTSRWIEEYAAICTPRGIRLLLDAAIESNSGGDSPLELADSSRRLGPGLNAVLLSMAKSDALKAGWPNLSTPSKLGALGWLIRSQGSLTVEQRRFIEAELGVNLNTVVTDAMADAGNASRLGALASGSAGPAFDELIRGSQAVQASASAQQAAEQAQAAAATADRARLAAVAEQTRLTAEVERLTAIINARPAAGATGSE
jgi:hypothetical protein